MKWFHLAFGLALFVIFTITGSYMRTDFPDKDVIPQDLRLLMRSRHIYILFSALIHLALGVYLTMQPKLWQRTSQTLGSALLTVASGLLVYAWYVETYQYLQFSNASREGIYISLAGIGMHLIGGLRVRPMQNLRVRQK